MTHVNLLFWIITIRDLRRRWKPQKDRLNLEQDSHPTAIRIHRAFSWMARVEDPDNSDDLDITLTCRWIAFNALYGQWDNNQREPTPDYATWQKFLSQILDLDRSGHLQMALTEHKRLVMSILDDEYLSRFFWEERKARQRQSLSEHLP